MARPRRFTSEASTPAIPSTSACTLGSLFIASLPGRLVRSLGPLSIVKVVTHEDYLAAITNAVCAKFPATAAALNQVHLVFGAGPRRRSLSTLHRVWGGGEAVDPLPLVEIAAIGGLSPPETCHVLLHELAHVLAPEAGHGKAWRHAARQIGLVRPRAMPDAGELADWQAISPALLPALQAIPPPTEPAPAEFFEDRHRLPCGAGYGTRGGTSRGKGSGSRYLKVVCRHPGCGYQVRVTSRWLAIGTPHCPVAGHGSMVLEEAPAGGQLRLLDGTTAGAAPGILFAGGVEEVEA